MNAVVEQQTEAVLEHAAARAAEKNLPYRGAVTPTEAWALAQAGVACLVDVRSSAEWTLIGRIPGAAEIELKRFPGWQANPDFLAEVKRRFRPDQRLLFVCRSGQRSHDAAAQLAAAGYAESYNVLEGFEGDKGPEGRRDVNGWKVRGLPWSQ